MKAALLYIVCVLLCGRLILTQHLPWCWSLGQRNDNNYTYGGYGYNITETNECLSFCVSQPACVAVDFYLTNIELFQCWLFNGSDGVEMRETTGMQRFSLSRSCIDSLPRTSTSLPTTTTTPVSTTSCFITWSLLINTNVPGGTPNPATTVDACMAACLGCYPACRGIDFEEWASPDSVVVCWLSWNGVSDYGRAPGIGHYTLVERSCYAGVLTPSNNSWCTRNATTPSQTSTTTTTTTTPFDGSSTTHSTPTSTLMPPSITTTRTTTTTTAICDITWTAYFNSSTAGATPNAARTVVECKAACIGCLPSCYAIDFKESAAGRNETSCWLMLDQSSSVNYGGIPDVVHYTIAGRRQCIGGIQPQKNNTWCTPTTIQTSPTRTTSASTTITTSLTATTSDVCWTSMIDTHSWYGVGYEITNLTECLASCVSQPACRSVDWDSNNADGLTCWLFETDAPLGEVIGVTHYILNRGCAGTVTVQLYVLALF